MYRDDLIRILHFLFIMQALHGKVVDGEGQPLAWKAPRTGKVVRSIHAGVCVCVMGSSPTTRRWILSNLLSLPPTTPTSPPSCEWVPGVSWGANHSSFSLNSGGPGGTSGAHTACCEKVAGPPASS